MLVNRDDAVAYHRDQTSPPGAVNIMVTFREAMGGGVCVFPERGLGFQCDDGWALSFDGRALLHGVTPLEPESPEAYRLSAVFYSLKGVEPIPCQARPNRTEPWRA